MSAVQRGRAVVGLGSAVALAAALGLAAHAAAQQGPRPSASAPAQAAGRANVAPANGVPPAPAGEQAVVEVKAIPVNPGDPVAVVNGEVITRQQLADECVARKGQEILDTLINYRLIDQALRKNNLKVTQDEILAEIDRIAAATAGLSREAWLRTLAKERNISPAQYARDVVYPALALRKLAEPRVQITEQDMAEAFESHFGEKLVYRMIVCRSLDHAKQVWEELKKNPGSFAQVAQNDPRSIDPATRATAGEVTTGPMPRHANPREVSREVFRQLVDGDPSDKPEQKPGDGDFTGPIQVTDGVSQEADAWIIVERKGLIPARSYDKDDPDLAKQFRQLVFDAKVQFLMEQVYGEIVQTSLIDNKLTGVVKQAQRQQGPSLLDMDVKRSAREAAPAAPPTPGTNPPAVPAPAEAAAADAAAKLPKLPTPAGISPEEARLRQNADGSPK